MAGAAFVALAGTGCGETAESYCHGIYDDGGTTPGWADSNFDDYPSCVDWYHENEPTGPGT